MSGINDKKSLGNETATGVLWNFISRILQLAIQFVLTLVLSRLLVPEDFATIGLLSFFTAVSAVLIDSGFGQTLIRKQDLDELDCSSVFFFNVVLSIIIYLILFFCSGFIASYFNIPELKVISRIVFITIVLNATQIVPFSLLNHKMEFKGITIASIVSLTISAIAGVLSAIFGLGVFSIVIQMLVYSFLYTILLFFSAKWRPHSVFSWARIKSMMNFSINLLFTGLIKEVFNNIYTLIIGRRFTPQTLGYYTQAKKIEEIPSLSITTIIQNVSYSAMSKVQNDLVKLQSAYKRILSINIYIIFPIMAMCFVSARHFIPVLFGWQWIPIVPMFRILCIYGAIFPLASINSNIVKVLGKGKAVLILEVVRRGLMVIFIALTIFRGVELMLWGWIASMVLYIIFSFYYCGSFINYSGFTQIRHSLYYLIIAIVPAIIPEYINVFFEDGSFIALLIQISSYAAIYLLLSYLLKVPAFVELLSLAKNMSLKSIINSK